ncbi:MAG: glycosyltransferase [Acidobacteriota bacterium]|nr:glycosyltransferase [Acidobacteriota bacterium]
MEKILRVAFFPDSYLEVNGVAMTSQRLVGYAREHGFPFLCVHAGAKTEVTQNGSVTFVSLKRSPASFTMDEDLKYDPLFQRHSRFIEKELEKFRPDVFHITGLNDVSITGAYLAWKMKTAMVGSWHTNLHEYAAHRLQNKFGFLPEKISGNLTNFIERKILDGAKLYYKMPQILLAPNEELIEMLEKGTGRKARLMIRGVDTNMFAPEKRTKTDDKICFGFVGRLRAEKNVRLLAKLEKELLARGKNNIKFSIVGEGSERTFLEQNMRTAEFTGFLEGERLAEAYANIDIFVFPSGTDAFGNVIQEANASGVPCLVTDQGGPKFIVREGETGFIAKDFNDFVKFSVELIDNPEKLAKLKKNSRHFAISRSWEAVFESVYNAYREAFDLRNSKSRTTKR